VRVAFPNPLRSPHAPSVRRYVELRNVSRTRPYHRPLRVDVLPTNQRDERSLSRSVRFSWVPTCVPGPRRLSKGGRNREGRKPTPFLHLVTPASARARFRARRSPQRKMRFTNEKRRRHLAETPPVRGEPPRHVLLRESTPSSIVNNLFSIGPRNEHRFS